MGLISKLLKSPVWLMIPTIAVACMVGLVVMGYDPLTFNPALVKQAQAAQKANLKNHDAEKEATGESVPVGTPAPPNATKTAAAPSANLKLADGTWTGYAACGQGNADGWKPYYVSVTIQVKDGKVARITNVSGSSTSDSGSSLSWDPNENQAYLDWANSGRGGSSGVTVQINSTLSSGKSVSGVDTVSGATYSSVAIYNAYVAAVNKAAKANGNKAKSKKTKEKKPKSKDKGGSSKTVGDNASDELNKSALADGSWIGYAACGEGNDEEWSPYYVAVTVEVSGGKVQAVKSVAGTSTGETGAKTLNWKESENKAYLDWASSGRTRGGVRYTGVVDQITASIQAGAIPASIDTVSGATYSSEAIFRAFYAALKKSAAAAGSSIDEPADTPSTEPGGDTPTDDPSGGSEDPSGGDEPDEPAPGGDESSEMLVDGTYSGHAFCKDLDSPSTYSPYYIIAEIEVADGRISRISNVYADSEGVIDSRYRYDSSENSTYLDFAINGVGKRVKGMVAKMQEKLDAGENPTAVDMVSGATWSSKSIVDAYKAAAASVPIVESKEENGNGEKEEQ